MDGGIGEAALMGAVIGGGSAALTGGDPIRGALMGGATSGVMGAMGGMSGVDPFTMGQTGTDAFTASQAVTPEIANAGGYTANIPVGGSEAAVNAFPDGLSYDPGPGYASAMNAPVAPNTVDTQAFTGDGIRNVADSSGFRGLDIVKANPWKYGMIGASQALPGLLTPRGLKGIGGTEEYDGPLSKFKYSPDKYTPAANPTPNVYTPVYKDYRMAEGGIAALANGGSLQNDPVNVDFMGGDMYPQSQIQHSTYAVPSQMPTSAQQTLASYEPKTNPLTGQPVANMAHGGIADLGGYSDGGRMLKGPGDGMSDSIPASIGGKQPARLADGEFVVPADVVSHLGNGSTDAGAKQLYSMMDKVRKARTGNKKQGKQINPKKFMPV